MLFSLAYRSAQLPAGARMTVSPVVFKSLLSNPGQTGRERNVGQARAVAESIVADFCHALGNIDPDQPYLAKAPLYVNLPQAPGQLQFRQVAGAKSAFLNAPHILGHGVAFPVYGTPQQPDPNLSNGTPFLIRNRDSLSTHGGRTSPGISLSAFRRPRRDGPVTVRQLLSIPGQLNKLPASGA